MFQTPQTYVDVQNENINNMNNADRQRQSARDKIANPDLYIESMVQRAAAAERFMTEQGFETVSQNGQRISTNIYCNAYRMDQVKWNEVFIGKLPRDMFEDELLPFLLNAGQVYKIRYMMDFSSTNRGFCFVKYVNTEQAIGAIKYLDGLKVAAGSPPIGAKMSFDNKRLFFWDLPQWCTEQKLINALHQAEVDGIQSVRMSGPSSKASPPNRNSLNGRRPSRFSGDNHCQYFNGPRSAAPEGKQQTALVEFESHDAATGARRLLLPGDVRLFDRKIRLDWAASDIPQAIALRLKQEQIKDNSPKSNYHHHHHHQPMSNPAMAPFSAVPISLPHQQAYQLRQRTMSVAQSGGHQSESSLSSTPSTSNDYLNEQIQNFININPDLARLSAIFSGSDSWSLPMIASPNLPSLVAP